MHTAYLISKAEITFLVGALGDAHMHIPAAFVVDISGSENMITASLLRKGFLYKNGGMYDAEKTMAFLICQLCSAEYVSVTTDEKTGIYYCDDLLIAVEEDLRAKSLCRITPIRGETELNDFLSDRKAQLNEKVRIGVKSDNEHIDG